MQSKRPACMRSETVLKLARRHYETGEPMSPWLTWELINLAEHGAETPAVKRHDKQIQKIQIVMSVNKMERGGKSLRQACEALHETNAMGYEVAGGGTYRKIVERERARQKEAFFAGLVRRWLRESVATE